jgi:carbonic anhydrase
MEECDRQDAIERLTQGYLRFQQDYAGPDHARYREEATIGQTPEVIVISCSDARVNPALITGSKLGEIFSVSNVANIVPPYRPDKGTHHSTSAALEFGVGTLKVKHIVVMGHSGCGGVKALLDGAPLTLDGEYSFIKPWVAIIEEARERVKSLPPAARYEACEKEALKISLSNLRSFPWIAERLEQGSLSLHAWHFDIPTGAMTCYDAGKDAFLPLEAWD